jgi:hypothetical protein
VNAVVLELQRTEGAKVTMTLEIEAEAEDGFSDADIGVVRDNARQLKFQSGIDRLRMIDGGQHLRFLPGWTINYRRNGIGTISAGRGSWRAFIFVPNRSTAARSGSSARWA